ncbi:MAG: hypothetical protein U0790_26145 [Isosphaeraceae bacterium]
MLDVARSCRLARAWTVLGAMGFLALSALAGSPALAGPPTLQFADFYYPDGTPVVSDGGMPFVHAALFRYSDQRKPRITWQIMTQGLTPGASYDIWIEGTDDGSQGSAFSWQVGTARATPQGDLDAIGTVYPGEPPGEFVGAFTDPAAPLFLVITTPDGTVAQVAFFPAP